jgi:hypothetical protein
MHHPQRVSRRPPQRFICDVGESSSDSENESVENVSGLVGVASSISNNFHFPIMLFY